MLRQLVSLLPAAARSAASAQLPALQHGFRAVADVEVNLADRETLKKYVGVRDHLSKEPATKGKLVEALQELLGAVKELPASSDYRRAVEATSQYRLKVCEANAADADVEEVLDAHLEELIAECKEEITLLPVIKDTKPWDVDASYQVPVFDYQDAANFLSQPKK